MSRMTIPNNTGFFSSLRSPTPTTLSDPAFEEGNDPFDFDDYDEQDFEDLFDKIKDELTTIEQQGWADEVDGDFGDYLDVLGTERITDQDRPDMIPRITEPHDFTAAKRTIVPYVYHNLRYDPDGYLFVKMPHIVYFSKDKYCIVGRTRGSRCNIELQDMIPTEVASLINESGNMKGTGLGFSSFLHSCAIAIISTESGIIEPLEGFDYIKDGTTHEVTGLNYMKRTTNADIVWNKYALCELYIDLDHDISEAMKASLSEDQSNSDFFVDGAFYQGKSPYTQQVDRLHHLTNILSDKSFHGLELMATHYITSLPADLRLEPITKVDPKPLDDAIKRGCKEFGGLYVPSPFRVLAGTNPAGINMIEYKSYTNLAERIPKTHFHTHPQNEDPTANLISTPTFSVDNPMHDYGSATRILFGSLLKFKIFQSIYIESELLSKIQGKSGCFWSNYSRAGINWKVVRNNSLTYYVSYYRFGDPGRECGIWSEIDEIHSIWSSPTFKISLSDISFAKVLPYRVYSSVASTMAYCKRGERNLVVTKILMAAATCRWSTWQTSALAGDFRFFSLCAVSGSGDINKMAESAASKVIKPITFSDYYVLHLIREFANRSIQRCTNETPLLRLPIRFLAIEKDLALGHMWHLRGSSHATDCFKKLAQGAIQEFGTRLALIEIYKRQADFLEKLILLGCTQGEFNDLMGSAPSFPYYNHVLFIGLANIAGKYMDVGRRQEPVGLNLSKIVSDHHCIYIEKHDQLDRSLIKSPRVADGLNTLLEEYNQPLGIHVLLLRMNKGKKIWNIYTIHPKDSKSKNREIPQMTTHMRIPQFISESLLSIYTDEEDVDMMQTSTKYSDFVTQFSGIMKNGGLSRSEDKSFFCGWMHPEGMSLAIYALGRVLHSPSMITSAAILRCDTFRYTVLPPDADESVADGINERILVYIPRGKKISTVIATKNYIHFMQGVRALGGAVVNTVFSVGIDKIQKLRCPDIERTAVMTTSDDSARGVLAKKNSEYNAKSIHADYINIPTQLVKHCMMKDSADKPIRSSSLAEFNNVATGPNGMIIQQFIHPHLSIQPLNGDSFVDDLISVVSAGRMSLTWGDSIDVVRSVYDCMLVNLCQRWQITNKELDGVVAAGILPHTDEDLMVGKFCYTREAKLKVLSTLKPDVIDMIDQGKINVMDGLRSFRIKNTGKLPKIKLVQYRGKIERLSIVMDQINAGRLIRGRKAALVTRPLDYTHRVAAKNKFLEVMLGPTPNDRPELEKLLDLMPNPHDAMIVLTKPRYSDSIPLVMGATIANPQEISFKHIFCTRATGRVFSNILKPNENELINMQFDDVKKLFARQMQDKAVEGIRYKSPSGRPLSRFSNGNILNQAYTFSFYIDLPDIESSSNIYTHGGMAFPNFTPTFWGGNYLRTVSKNRGILAYGYAILGSEIYIFYKTMKSRPKFLIKQYNDEILIRHRTYDGEVFCLIRKDFSPINPMDYQVEFELKGDKNLCGDATALINYGNYLNTNARGANNVMKSIFNKFDCDYPNQITRYKPNYPFYPESSIKMPRSKIVVFFGSKYICKLELTYDPNPKYTTSINVGIFPPIFIESQDEDDDSAMLLE